MTENPSENAAASVPPEARKAFEEWSASGDDAALTRLVGALFKYLDVPDFESKLDEKGDAASIREDLGVDSLTLAEILFYTEDLLGLRIPNEDVLNLTTIGDLKKYLQAHRGKISAK
jgi:acyl carrier protein